MHFDRFDICEAYYLFARDYHGGQGSREYAYLGRLSNLGFKSGPFLEVSSLNENAKEIYDSLVEKYTNRGLAFLGARVVES